MCKEFQGMGKIVWNDVKNIETKYSKLKMMQFMAKYYSSDAKKTSWLCTDYIEDKNVR